MNCLACGRPLERREEAERVCDACCREAGEYWRPSVNRTYTDHTSSREFSEPERIEIPNEPLIQLPKLDQDAGD